MQVKASTTDPRGHTGVRIAVWNCQQGFRRKTADALSLDADVLIVPECSQKDAQQNGGYWVGRNLSKGLAIFVRKPLALEPVPLTSAPEWATLVRVYCSGIALHVLAVWDYNHRSKSNVVDALTDALGALPTCVDAGALVVAGDFNTNPIWDSQFPVQGNHQAKVAALQKLGLISAYHHFFAEKAGQESRPTIYWRRHRNAPYHVDYIFVPGTAVESMVCEVGSFEDWTGNGLSDHVPIAVTFDGRFGRS